MSYELNASNGAATGGWDPLVPAGTSTEVVFVVGDQVVGPGDESLHSGCKALARSVDAELLGVEFARGPHGAPVFAGASPVPDLTKGGDALIAALETELSSNGGPS